MKKVLLLLLSLVIIVSLVEAKIVSDSIYQIPKTKVVPVIDGLQDQIWKAIDWNMQRQYTVDGTGADSGFGLTGLTKVLWDKDNIYWLFYSVDDVLTDIPANFPGAMYNMDAMELYFDKDNDHSTKTSRGATQYQFTIPHMLKGVANGNLGAIFGSTFDTAGCEVAITDVNDTEGFPGWMTEVKIPLANLGVDGTSAADQLIGWELQQDESDDVAANRQSMSKWWSGSNLSWANPGIWGTAILSSREVDTVLQIVKANNAITIDGVLDNEYKKANVVTTNLYRVDATSTDVADTDPMFGGFITAYPMWDATNMYIFLDVVDGILTDIPANWPGATYNMDAVEIYYDGTNDHSTKTSRGATQYQFTISHLLKDVANGNLGAIFGSTFDTTGCEVGITDHDARNNDGMLTEEGAGWNCEVKIPLASLGIDGSSAGALLGFEIQLDNASDAAAGRVGMQKWWNSSNLSWANPGIWGYAELVSGSVGVKGGSQSIANQYRLNQNYPNPFNPSTEISFSLAKSEKVKLTVYNLLGKEVAVLVNGVRNAGPQTVTFNAPNLSSGVYFYKLEAGSTVLSKKMMLLK
jgi:hypothetical protein